MIGKNIMTLDNVGIGYKVKSQCRRIVSPISATLHSHELVCLVGRNGCGKSTLLRTLAGLQSPLEGAILLSTPQGEIKLHSLRPAEVGEMISIVLTHTEPFNQATVEDVVALGRSPYTNFWGSLTPHDHAIIDQALAQIGIGELRHRKINSLSDGERQKCLIAKAIAQQTDILLLDEPSAFLDYPSKKDLMNLLHRLTADEGKSIILSTHDVELAMNFADTIWHITSAQMKICKPCTFDINDL